MSSPSGPVTLITGGTGFVGLNLAEELLARGQRVVIPRLRQISFF